MNKEILGLIDKYDKEFSNFSYESIKGIFMNINNLMEDRHGWPSVYQEKVGYPGITGAGNTANGSIEICRILKEEIDFFIFDDNKFKICEIGAGGCRNLHYIKKFEMWEFFREWTSEQGYSPLTVLEFFDITEYGIRDTPVGSILRERLHLQSDIDHIYDNVKKLESYKDCLFFEFYANDLIKKDCFDNMSDEI